MGCVGHQPASLSILGSIQPRPAGGHSGASHSTFSSAAVWLQVEPCRRRRGEKCDIQMSTLGGRCFQHSSALARLHVPSQLRVLVRAQPIPACGWCRGDATSNPVGVTRHGRGGQSQSELEGKKGAGQQKSICTSRLCRQPRY